MTTVELTATLDASQVPAWFLPDDAPDYRAQEWLLQVLSDKAVHYAVITKPVDRDGAPVR